MSSSGPVWAILALTWTTLGADLRNFPVWRGCAYVWVIRIQGFHAFCDRKDGAEGGEIQLELYGGLWSGQYG